MIIPSRSIYMRISYIIIYMIIPYEYIYVIIPNHSLRKEHVSFLPPSSFFSQNFPTTTTTPTTITNKGMPTQGVVDEEGDYSMIHLQNQEEGAWWNSKVKASLVLLFFVGLCVALILAIIVPLGEGETYERTYYLGCEKVNWHYAPIGRNVVRNRDFTSREQYETGCDEECDTYVMKASYLQYTDDTFTTKSEIDESLGIMGPVIRARVGDTIKVVLKNFLEEENCGVHVHGLKYERSQEAEEYATSFGDKKREETNPSVPPGETFTYTWSIPERSGPGANEQSSKAWMYHAPLSEPMNPNSGLFGMVVIANQYSSTSEGFLEDINNEAFVALAEFEDDQDGCGCNRTQAKTKYTINGYMYGNNPAPIVSTLEKTTRWYVASFSSSSSGQTIHWHGNTVSSNQKTSDVLFVPSMGVEIVDMEVDNEGLWMFSTTEKDKPGMEGLYLVEE